MIAKKLLSLLLAILIVFGLSACSVDQETIDLAADVAIALLEEAAEQTPASETSQEPDIKEQDEPLEIFEETNEPEESDKSEEAAENKTISDPLVPDEDGVYTSKEDVALYLHIYGHLPNNFMTKSEARKLGWEGGGLDDYAEGMCIGGDKFGNYEGLLPDAEGRRWLECDIDTLHQRSRGAKRIVFSNDGLIYYTDDHYESFELLYGEE